MARKRLRDKQETQQSRRGRKVRPLAHGLNAKRLLNECEVSYARAARVAGISPSTLSDILNHGKWPSKPTPETIQLAIESALREQGATEEQLASAWEWSGYSPAHERIANGNNGNKRHLGVRMLDDACLKHFGLKRNPFEKQFRGPDEMLWLPPFNKAHRAILKTIEQREFACVSGESGSGKTSLRMMVEEQYRNDPNVKFVRPFDVERERMQPHAIIEGICRDLGVTKLPQSREARYRLAERRLSEATRQGARIILMIEEAHAMTDESLKSLKRIFELARFERLIGIILWAQPELTYGRFYTMDWQLREVIQRCYVIPLGGIYEHTEKYLRHKIEAAGGAFDKIFTSDAVRAIKKRLKPTDQAPLIDTPLRANALASNAMVKAFETTEPVVSADSVARSDSWLLRA